VHKGDPAVAAAGTVPVPLASAPPIPAELLAAVMANPADPNVIALLASWNQAMAAATAAAAPGAGTTPAVATPVPATALPLPAGGAPVVAALANPATAPLIA